MGQIRADGDRGTGAVRSGRPPEVVLDQWVARLETATGTPRRVPRRVAPSERNGTARHTADPSGLSAPQLAKMREALAAIDVRGSSIVFADAVGGTIVLGRSGERIVHPGTVAVRGPYGLTLGSLRRHGLNEPQSRGVEFVAAWFGSPFDALSVDRKEGGRSLSWGFWPLGSADVGRALALWKERAGASFDEMLGAYGVDVAPPAEQDLSGPALLLVDSVKGSLLQGDRALDAIARDSRRLALLARAGRHDDAKAAQLEVALRPILPVFRTSVPCGKERVALGTIASSARAVAALVLAVRALDLTGMTDILARTALESTDDAEAKLVASVLKALAPRPSPMAGVALAMRRTLSSPELGA